MNAISKTHINILIYLTRVTPQASKDSVELMISIFLSKIILILGKSF